MNNEEVINYLVNENRQLTNLIEELKGEIQTLKNEVNYNSLVAMTASPAFTDEERKNAIYTVKQINERKQKEQEAREEISKMFN